MEVVPGVSQGARRGDYLVQKLRLELYRKYYKALDNQGEFDGSSIMGLLWHH